MIKALAVIGAITVTLLSGARPASAQLMPPIVRPLPTSRTTALAAQIDTLRVRSEAAIARAATLTETARSLRENRASVTSVLALLVKQADDLRTQAGQSNVKFLTDSIGASYALARATELEVVRQPSLKAYAAARKSLDSIRAVLRSRADTTIRSVQPDSTEARLVAEVASLARDTSAHAVDSLQREAKALTGYSRDAFKQAMIFDREATNVTQQLSALAADTTRRNENATRLEAEAKDVEMTTIPMKARQDTLKDAFREITAINARLWLPAMKRTEAMEFYGESGRDFLRNIAVNFDGFAATSSTTEVVSDYAGPVRVALNLVTANAKGTGLSATDSSGKKSQPADPSAVERFYAGGGTATISASWPVLFSHSLYHSLTIQTMNKAGFDAAGNASPDSAGHGAPMNGDIGAEAYFTFTTFTHVFNVFMLGRVARVWGNDAWAHGLSSTTGTFRYSQGTFGIDVQLPGGVPGFRILGAAVAGPAVLRRDFSWTIQVAPTK